MCLQTVLDNPQMTSYEVVQANFKTYCQGRRCRGVAEGAARRLGRRHCVRAEGGRQPAQAGSLLSCLRPAGSGPYEIAFKADPSLYDGRFSNNGWLQELPKQITHLSWDNAALVSMETMTALKVEERDLIEIESNGQKVTFPVLMQPGLPEGVITVHLGFGRWFGRGWPVRRLRCKQAAQHQCAVVAGRRESGKDGRHL